MLIQVAENTTMTSHHNRDDVIMCSWGSWYEDWHVWYGYWYWYNYSQLYDLCRTQLISVTIGYHVTLPLNIVECCRQCVPIHCVPCTVVMSSWLVTHLTSRSCAFCRRRNGPCKFCAVYRCKITAITLCCGSTRLWERGTSLYGCHGNEIYSQEYQEAHLKKKQKVGRLLEMIDHFWYSWLAMCLEWWLLLLPCIHMHNRGKAMPLCLCVCVCVYVCVCRQKNI